MSETYSKHSNRVRVTTHAGSMTPGELAVSRSNDGQYLLLYAGQTLLAIYGAMGADPEYVEFADGGRFAVDDLLDMVGGM